MAQPRWQQLAQTIQADLHALPPGSPVPAEAELAESYGVAKMTAAQALQHLAAQGLITRVRGHGTVTRDRRPILLHTSRHAAAARGAKAGGPWSVAVASAGMTPTVKLLRVVRVTEFPEYVAEVFDEEMIRRDRLMSADGQPAALSVSWIPARIADGTRLAEPIMMPEGAYAVLREIGHPVTRAVETVRSRPAADTERKALQLPKGAPSLAVERISYGAGDSPIEFLETVADATRVSIQHSIDL